MAYIKSYSNYVLKKKHQDVTDGTIWERDITTIGGLNTFSKGQLPIYKSGNFIITVNADNGHKKQVNSSRWNSNSESGEVWTLQSISALTSESEYEDDTKIVLKKDYYDFRDFAYYGSLSELFRASINDALVRFPGELYAYSGNPDVYYDKYEIIDGNRVLSQEKLGPSGANLLDNPFGIDIHSASVPSGADPLKYFAESGYSNYTIIVGEEEPMDILEDGWEVKYLSVCTSAGTLIATIDLSASTSFSFTVSAYVGNNNNVYYFTDKEDIHIRPNDTYINKFYNECNSLQRLLFDNSTTPKYKATFSVINENDFGFYRKLEDFIFPTLAGGYNLDVSSYGFNMYTSRLSDIGEYYDENFTDNLYRSMTHESIKNFDWSFTREYNEELEEEYVNGGERVQKILRVFAREFDEIKSYIDAIKDINRVTYDERNNLPDYFLTDSLDEDGWDVMHVYPYSIEDCRFYQNTKEKVSPYSNEHSNDNVKDGYYIVCCKNEDEIPSEDIGANYSGTTLHFKQGSGDSHTYLDKCAYNGEGVLRDKIMPYFNDKEYSVFEIGNEFLRRLKLNSRAIWRSKGTLESLRMVLAVFGMKEEEDYSFTEYTTVTTGISAIVNGIDIDKDLNRFKLINYGTSEYVPYQGLAVAYDEKDNWLYPQFNKNEYYDGGLYFQMNGGWICNYFSTTKEKTIIVTSTTAPTRIFDEDYCGNVLKMWIDDVLLPKVECEYTFSVGGPHTIKWVEISCYFQFNSEDEKITCNCPLFKETVRDIKSVFDIQELLSQSVSTLKDGCIYYVRNADENVIVADGKTYKVYSEYISSNTTANYVQLVKEGGIVSVGYNQFYSEYIKVNNRDGVQTVNYLRDKPDGYVIKAYLKDDGNFFLCEGENLMSVTYIVPPRNNGSSSDIYTNFFQLGSVLYSDTLRGDGNNDNAGWCRLTNDSQPYKILSTIQDYYKGNNPHEGNLMYDFGNSYFEYFEDLFKYAKENSLFDMRCVDYDTIGKITEDPIGFTDLKDESNPCGYNCQEDEKVSYFGNYVTSGGNKFVYGTDYTLADKDAMLGNDYYSTATHSEVTNQVMNNKRFKITFNLRECSDKLCEVKYLDAIVMNYLTQVIPSTTILEVEYNGWNDIAECNG